jgi:glucose/arabinose dehydrogenase
MMKIFIKLLFLSLIVLVSLDACTLKQSIPPRVGLQLIAHGFTSPVALIDPGDGSRRFFVVDQTGFIWILADGKRIEKPFLDIRQKVVPLNSFYDERGLLGLAFHPKFAVNGLFYISYSGHLQPGLSPTEWDHTTYISEFKVSATNPNQADPNSERIILAMDKPGYNYEAGDIAFGVGGYLYIATGDSVRDPATEAGKYAQNVNSLLGKILRIDVNGASDLGQNYLIPPENPFVTGAGRPEIFAYGFRNPYRFSFDVSGGKTRLLVGDVGQAMMEEVDLVKAGKNYGWSIREGTSCFNSQHWDQPLESCVTDGLSDPIIAYRHEGDLSAVIGGMIYRGSAIPELKEGYVFGDWGRGKGHIFIADPPIFGFGLWKVSAVQIQFPENQKQLGQLLDIGRDEGGELYLLTKEPGLGATGNSGAVYKIVPAN